MEMAIWVGIIVGSLIAITILAMLVSIDILHLKKGRVKAEVETLEKELNAAKDRRDEYDRAQKFLEERPQLEAEQKQLHEDIEKAESTLQNLTEAKTRLTEEAERLQGNIAALKEVEAEVATCRTEKEDLEKRIQDLKGDKTTLENKISDLETTLTRLRKDMATLEAERKEVELDIASKESRYKELVDKIKSLDEEVGDKKTKLDLDVQALAEIERDIATGRGDVAKMEGRKKELIDANEKLGATNESLKHENADWITKNAKQQETNRGLEKDAVALEARKSNAEKWLKDNASKLVHLNDLDHAIAQRQKEYETIGKRIEAVHKNLADAQRTLAETMKTVGSGIERLTKMNLSGVQTLRLSSFGGLRNGEGAFTLPDENACEAAFGSNGETVALNAVAEHFTRRGFEVPPRLLYAFHTALKTSDMSSLTVMAGVSGTGKSAIPKLYAEAMGIFFTPLAVEPRWDSPKDLMGFFNYVTNRYEPTPLARAMFQFQGHWADRGFRPEVELDRYMFMPMLDEMNLARIEYYFSEFLSKLEMRKLVGELTEETIPMIGMEVFQGFHGTVDGREYSEKPIHLFANTNTLFVGTMNEDETTQSLSDKVIDRANVLYFGKPTQLRPPAQRQQQEGERDAEHRRFPLLRETWRSWCHPVDEGALTGAREILSRLNDKLAEFNRPFAHRTYQAMLSYIANYPAVGGQTEGERARMALADQIGMRIMPKLRGIELNQHRHVLEEIGEILSDTARLNDPVLNEAFGRAIDPNKSNGFFRWNGFDWPAAQPVS